jgi:hypothetical protein
MASPLIFLIETVVKSTALTIFAAKLGALVATTGAVAHGFNRMAASSEVSFNRLKTQLGLLNLESKKNIGGITSYANKVSGSTRFAADTVQEAVTVALRKTGDVTKALKQVSVAQDIAAATGRDLITVTHLLNLAQSGRTTILRQITNLSNTEIQTAVKNGKLLDVLATKFKGAAARETKTYAGAMAVAANTTKQLGEELGALVLPIFKVGLAFQTAMVQAELFVVRGMKALYDPAKTVTTYLDQNQLTFSRWIGGIKDGINPLVSLGAAIASAGKDTKDLSDAQAAASAGLSILKSTTSRYEELIRMKIGKTSDQIREIEDEVKAVDEILIQAMVKGTGSLNAEQALRLKTFSYATAKMGELVTKEALIEEDTAKAHEDEILAIKKEAILKHKQWLLGEGASGEIKRRQSFLGNTEGEVITLTGKLGPVFSKLYSDILRAPAQAFQAIKKELQDLPTAIANLTSAVKMPAVEKAVIEPARKFLADVAPKWQFSFNITTSPEDVRNAVIETLRQQGLLGVISKAANEAQKQRGESKANASAG